MIAHKYDRGAYLLSRLVIGTLLIGLALIVLYAWSTPGSHVKYAAVGLLVALASLGAGSLLGFLLGVPKQVSTGRARLTEDGAWRYTPSTNLSEISDWLTKLLLGAGLVGLTRMGPPLGALLASIGKGLEDAPPSGNVSWSATVMAGCIVGAYTVLGVLGGYLVTTLWYFAALKAHMEEAESGAAQFGGPEIAQVTT
ncbi:MAG: hypothetical protein EOP32_00475 [Rhodococcus sp. (in: high G+C Gram-positive bacteria)]|nr:MAG: hypothetical protein EOP32_00475 [Rhodococcus sp. (in: high G+C Gram-positive bacteria)]